MRYLWLILIAGIILITGCTEKDENYLHNVSTLTFPVASFYFTGNEGPAPANVTFHNTSEYCDKYEWTFHNGVKSTEFEPTYTYYNNTGNDKTFLVILKVTDSGSGETNTRSKSVLIHPSE